MAQGEPLTIVTGKRLVAVGDLLGFRDQVLRQPSTRVVDTTVAYLRRALNFALTRDTSAEPPPLDDLERRSPLGIAWFSDTILLYASEDTAEANAFLLEAVAYLLFVTTIPSNARLRIGIDYDDLYADAPNRIYVGRAIINAYGLQASQAWSGGALTDNAAQRVKHLSQTHLVPYTVPGKNGTCSATAIDWTFGIHLRTTFPWSATSAEPPDPTTPIAIKWANTKAFHDAHCPTCRNPSPASPS